MEVYGTKPKRFTKEWWGYFWDYYKWHTIAGIIALIVIISAATECANQVKYDLQLEFITDKGLYNEENVQLEEIMAKIVEDASGNSKVETHVNLLNMVENDDPQMMQAMQTKLMIEQACPEGYIYVMSGKYLDTFSGYGMFLDASEWTDKAGINSEFVSLEGNKILEGIGIDGTDLYIAVLKVPEKEKDKEFAEKKMENGKRFASYLINEG